MWTPAFVEHRRQPEKWDSSSLPLPKPWSPGEKLLPSPRFWVFSHYDDPFFFNWQLYWIKEHLGSQSGTALISSRRVFSQSIQWPGNTHSWCERWGLGVSDWIKDDKGGAVFTFLCPMTREAMPTSCHTHSWPHPCLLLHYEVCLLNHKPK